MIANYYQHFSDMDGFQDGGYIWAQGVLQYHLIEVPCIPPIAFSNMLEEKWAPLDIRDHI